MIRRPPSIKYEKRCRSGERTILPGMLVVREVCRMLETKTVIPTTNSVREGFLMQWMQGEEEG